MTASVPTLAQLIRRLKAVKTSRTTLTAYRSATPEFAKQTDLLTGEGSRLYGSRWKPRGIAAVYASLTPETAMEESLSHFRYEGIALHAAMPRMFVAIQAKLSKAVDSTEGANRKRLPVAERGLLECDWRREMASVAVPLPQLLGQPASEAGLEALIVQSATDATAPNIVIFPENLRKSNPLSILSPDKL